jgi:hypothetical protein
LGDHVNNNRTHFSEIDTLIPLGNCIGGRGRLIHDSVQGLLHISSINIISVGRTRRRTIALRAACRAAACSAVIVSSSINEEKCIETREVVDIMK